MSLGDSDTEEMVRNMDELLQQAEEITKLVRAQDWMSDGLLKIDEKRAIATVQQLVRTAYSQGCLAGTTHTRNMMTRTFDAILSR